MFEKLHKPFFAILVTLVCGVAGLIILKIWGIELPDNLFWKIMSTLIVLVLLFGFLLVAHSDFGDKKKLKDDNYLD